MACSEREIKVFQLNWVINARGKSNCRILKQLYLKRDWFNQPDIFHVDSRKAVI